MKGVFIEEHGDIDVIKYANINDPEVKKNQVLVKVEAAAINHLDIWVRKGLPNMPLPLPLILGSDASGTVIEKKGNTEKYSIGDQVVIQPGTFNLNCDKVLDGNEN